MGTDLAYSVSLEDYISTDGTVTVADEAVEEGVVLVLQPNYNVKFNVTDGSSPIAGALISFNSTTGTTDDQGTYTFAEVLPANDMAYTITADGYEGASGTTNVVDQDITINETLTLIVYTVTFNVSDGTNALEGAVITFNGGDQTTDASGAAVFSDVVPGTALPYSVTLDYRYYDADGTVDVDGDETVAVTLALTSSRASLINTMEIYPNPSNGRIMIQGVELGASYELYNLAQQKIAEGILTGKEISLDAETGVYMLKVVSEENVYLKKLVIQ
jgi:hypothetical protein